MFADPNSNFFYLYLNANGLEVYTKGIAAFLVLILLQLIKILNDYPQSE